MDMIYTLQLLVYFSLCVTVPLAIYDRWVQHPVRIREHTPRPELYNQLYETLPLLCIGFFMIYFTLEQVLTAFTWLAVAIVLGAKITLRERFQHSSSIILEQARSYLWVLIVIWTVRSFIIQPYVVPTGSLEPTIQPGDFIAVTQYSYGVRMPILGDVLIPVAQPQHGDIALFRWPGNRDILYIKRVVGLPGDHIAYRNKTLYINDKPMPQHVVVDNILQDEAGHRIHVTEKKESLMNHEHRIQQYADIEDAQWIDVVVPPHHYFMMGDNRDNSSDSRAWGMVPDQNLVGKAQFIWLSLANHPFTIRWDRIGDRLV
jgi:signal peptidase I